MEGIPMAKSKFAPPKPPFEKIDQDAFEESLPSNQPITAPAMSIRNVFVSMVLV